MVCEFESDEHDFMFWKKFGFVDSTRREKFIREVNFVRLKFKRTRYNLLLNKQ